MNFIGHAEVARWTRGEPAFHFGAMLPDFLHMAGARTAAIRDATVAEGVANHHRVDAAFHGAPSFVALCAEGVARLVEAGVRKGTARAVAHVGTELLLDGVLLRRTEVEAAYVAAIGWADGDTIASALELEPAALDRLRALGARLRAWGAPRDYIRPAFVAERLDHALRARPRLALTADERGALVPFLERRLGEVEERAPSLLSEVRARVGDAID